MAQDTKSRKLHSHILRWRKTTTESFLLSDSEFRFAAECERMRVDRNGSVLALLLVKLNHKQPEDLAFFTRVLEGRLRVTDTPGLLKDGRVAVLLPDTGKEGAWKVATDISEVFPPGPSRPECDVLVYPHKDHKPKSGSHTGGSHGGGSHHDNETLDEITETLDQITEEEIAASGRGESSQTTEEFFFARPMPAWKRTLDIVGGSVGLICSLPIVFAGVIAVKATSPGPAFFKQEREGLGGKRFKMWKLRTMRVDAEQQKSGLRQFSAQDGPAFKMKRDPRTTLVGRFLRWTSMDELPQFWNVVKGDMSLVGPRPLPTEESMACEGWHRRRLHVAPGMTCTWQVGERGNVSFDEWVRMDLRYAKKTSFFEDVRIMIVTIPSLLIQKGLR